MNEILQAETPTAGAAASERLKSLDAYRGLIMVILAFGGFGLAGTAGMQLKTNPDSQVWAIVQHQLVHAQWTGCRFWDMIQPSFMFMVGVSMAYSYAKRKRKGHSYIRMLSHAAWRSIVLVFLGVFLSSNGRRSINWTFANVRSDRPWLLLPFFALAPHLPHAGNRRGSDTNRYVAALLCLSGLGD